jgi:hypothetical protein
MYSSCLVYTKRKMILIETDMLQNRTLSNYTTFRIFRNFIFNFFPTTRPSFSGGLSRKPTNNKHVALSTHVTNISFCQSASHYTCHHVQYDQNNNPWKVANYARPVATLVILPHFPNSGHNYWVLWYIPSLHLFCFCHLTSSKSP